MAFEKSSQDFTDFSWVDNISGDFITCSTKVGALKLWNASNASQKDTIKVVPQGIVSMHPMPGRQSTFLLQIKNGQIVLFNVRKRKILFQSDVAHSAQVQKVAINPLNHLRMASVGYDNSVRIWDLSAMAVVSVIEDKNSKTERDGQINALSWCPNSSTANDELLCIGTVGGQIKIIDAKKNRVVTRLEVTTGTIFEIDWSNSSIVACSEDNHL
jgi:WD40 repeat protein